MQWIKMSEQSPDDQQRILIIIRDEALKDYEKRVYTAKFHAKSLEFAEEAYFETEHYCLSIGPLDVAYWMPMPEMPEDSK